MGTLDNIMNMVLLFNFAIVTGFYVVGIFFPAMTGWAAPMHVGAGSIINFTNNVINSTIGTGVMNSGTINTAFGAIPAPTNIVNLILALLDLVWAFLYNFLYYFPWHVVYPLLGVITGSPTLAYDLTILYWFFTLITFWWFIMTYVWGPLAWIVGFIIGSIAQFLGL